MARQPQTRPAMQGHSGPPQRPWWCDSGRHPNTRN
jgi:hypothetical protein